MYCHSKEPQQVELELLHLRWWQSTTDKDQENRRPRVKVVDGVNENFLCWLWHGQCGRVSWSGIYSESQEWFCWLFSLTPEFGEASEWRKPSLTKPHGVANLFKRPRIGPAEIISISGNNPAKKPVRDTVLTPNPVRVCLWNWKSRLLARLWFAGFEKTVCNQLLASADFSR